MTSKQEREQRRAERVAAEQAEAAAARRRLIAGYFVAGLLSVAVVIGIVVVIAGGDDGSGQVDGKDVPGNAHIQPATGELNGLTPDDREGTAPPPLAQGDLEVSAEEAGCELKLDLTDEGTGHVKSDELPDYETNPPTSGDHDPVAQADGAFADVPDTPGHVVHSMEHGRVEIQYAPDLPEEDQLALKGVFDEDAAGMLLFPNAEMPYEVAVTAWTQLMGCDAYEGPATLDAVRNFRDIYRGQGPEAVPMQF